MTAGLSLLLAATASAAASPKIFWVSKPVVPGETALVAFSQPAAAPALALLKHDVRPYARKVPKGLLLRRRRGTAVF